MVHKPIMPPVHPHHGTVEICVAVGNIAIPHRSDTPHKTSDDTENAMKVATKAGPTLARIRTFAAVWIGKSIPVNKAVVKSINIAYPLLPVHVVGYGSQLLYVLTVAVAVYLYLVQGGCEGGVFLICQFNVRRAEVFRDAALAAHTGNGHDEVAALQYPREADLRRCASFLFRISVHKFEQRSVGFHVLRRETGYDPAHVVALELVCRTVLAAQKAVAHRRERHEAYA